MRVILLTDAVSKSGGGVSEVTKQLCYHMQNKSNVDLSILAYNDSVEPDDSSFNEKGLIDFYHISQIPLLNKIGYSSDIDAIISRVQPNIIDSQGLWMYHSNAVVRYKKSSAVKTVITPHGMLDPWAIENSRWKKIIVGHLFEYRNLNQADCIKALCKAEYDSIRAFGLKNPVAIIPNGIEIPVTFRPTQKRSKRTLLFLGRIHPKKGLLQLIKALAIVKSNNPELLSNWEVRIAGWNQNDYLKQLLNEVNVLGLDETISFIGPVFGESKTTELANADAFILTSFSEGLPMSVLEAWSFHLPVIMTDKCNLPEGFNTDSAVRVDTTPESISEGLLSVFKMPPSRLIQMGDNGYKLVSEYFSWERVSSSTLRLYEWLLHGGETPDFVMID